MRFLRKFNKVVRIAFPSVGERRRWDLSSRGDDDEDGAGGDEVETGCR